MSAFAAVTACLVLMGMQNTPAPDWSDFKALGEDAIRSQLVDPQSAVFQWPYAMAPGPNGYWTCGLVNSKNRMGGYSGDSYFSVVVDNTRVVHSQVSDGRDHVAWSCEKAIRKAKIRLRSE